MTKELEKIKRALGMGIGTHGEPCSAGEKCQAITEFREALAGVERLEAERQSDTEILDWMEDNPGVALRYGLGGKLWRAVDALEKGFHRNIIASGKTLRETALAAIESTKESANG